MKYLDLSGKWTSSFIQNNKIYNEEVNFTQEKNKLKADITLNYDNQICHYKFNGIITSKYVNGNYEQIGSNDIESGTISLKIINKDFLYGIATYISDDSINDDIIESPYALFRNTNNKLGTFNPCKKCINQKINCCSNEEVDAPMVLPNEVDNISKIMNISKNDFAKKIDFSKIHNDNNLKYLYQLKKQNNNACYFYQNNKCTIYDIRPIDCRIFPYDIKLENDGNYYLVYYKTDKCPMVHENIKDIKMISYNTRIYLRLLFPYIKEWSDKLCCTKLTKNHNYEIICKIKDLF